MSNSEKRGDTILVKAGDTSDEPRRTAGVTSTNTVSESYRGISDGAGVHSAKNFVVDFRSATTGTASGAKQQQQFCTCHPTSASSLPPYGIGRSTPRASNELLLSVDAKLCSVESALGWELSIPTVKSSMEIGAQNLKAFQNSPADLTRFKADLEKLDNKLSSLVAQRDKYTAVFRVHGGMSSTLIEEAYADLWLLPQLELRANESAASLQYLDRIEARIDEALRRLSSSNSATSAADAVDAGSHDDDEDENDKALDDAIEKLEDRHRKMLEVEQRVRELEDKLQKQFNDKGKEMGELTDVLYQSVESLETKYGK